MSSCFHPFSFRALVQCCSFAFFVCKLQISSQPIDINEREQRKCPIFTHCSASGTRVQVRATRDIPAPIRGSRPSVERWHNPLQTEYFKTFNGRVHAAGLHLLECLPCLCVLSSPPSVLLQAIYGLC